jgi:hypothetical protein
MDNKYQVPKPKKPETRSEVLAAKIEDLVKQRDRTPNLAEKQRINAEITKLFAQWQRLKL